MDGWIIEDGWMEDSNQFNQWGGKTDEVQKETRVNKVRVYKTKNTQIMTDGDTFHQCLHL